MPKQRLSLGRNWYAIHTVIGFEDIVVENILKRADAFDMRDKIYNAIVPKEKMFEVKGGKRQVAERKIYPGYVLVDMIVTDDSWYLVRNTPKVTGFVGTGVTPIPIDRQEIDEIFRRMNQGEPEYEMKLQEGDLVKIVDGVFRDTEGKVSEIDRERGRLKVLVALFNRETPVEVDMLQVQKM